MMIHHYNIVLSLMYVVWSPERCRTLVEWFVECSVEYLKSPPDRERWGGLPTSKLFDKTIRQNYSTTHMDISIVYSLRNIGANCLLPLRRISFRTLSRPRPCRRAMGAQTAGRPGRVARGEPAVRAHLRQASADRQAWPARALLTERNGRRSSKSGS